MAETPVISWSDYFEAEMPKTISEFREFVGKQDSEFFVQDDSGEGHLLLRSPSQELDSANLIVQASKRVALSHPPIGGAVCVGQVAVGLIRSSIKESDGLEEATAEAFQGIRLSNVGFNARTENVTEINVGTKTMGEKTEEMRRLATKKPKPLVGNGCSTLSELGLLLNYAAAATDNAEDKEALEHIRQSGLAFTRIEPEDWPSLAILKDKGDQLLAFSQESPEVRHVDLLVKIEPERGIVQTLSGEQPIQEIGAGMRLRKLPLIDIPPQGIAGPDLEEIEARRRLGRFPWNSNL